ncbi:MAG: DUF6600 domain-containing protein [Nitrospirota bacterium]|mgnify:FL=1|jgi:hypothetical protein
MFKKYLFLSLLFLIIPFSLSLAEEEPEGYVARISLINGDVSLKRGDDKDWIAASINMPLQTGDYIYSPKVAKAEVQFDNGAHIRLSENTDLGILNLSGDIIQLKIGAGRATLGIRELSKSGAFEVDTANVAITPLASGRYRIDVDEDGNTVLTIQKGKAEVTTDGGSITISDGQRISIEGIDSQEYEIAQADKRDAWDEWNDERDGRLATVKSKEYVPVYISGVEDLDAHGRWAVVPEYGYVWTPTVVEVGWAPYRAGRWVWRDPWGWVWVSYEPWGWAPYHYGRWVFVTSIGWCWMPEERRAAVWRWRPGLVRFAMGPSWVAWVPLGPREVYYWRHTPSVSVGVSVNVNITNSVTIVHRDTFLRGVKVSAPLPPNPFKTGKIIAGPPLIVPTKASLAPLPTKVVPRYAVPSAKVIHRPAVVKTTPPPAPKTFYEKKKEIKASGGLPVKELTHSPKTGEVKKEAIKGKQAMPAREIKSGKGTFKPKETKPSPIERERRNESKKEIAPKDPDRKKVMPEKRPEGKKETRPEKRPEKRKEEKPPVLKKEGVKKQKAIKENKEDKSIKGQREDKEMGPRKGRKKDN